MNNKLKNFLLISASIVAFSAFADNNKIIAEINDSKVTLSDMQKFSKAKLGDNPQFNNKKFSDLPPELQRKLVEHYVNQKLLLKEVANSKVSESKEFKAKLSEIKKDLEMQIFITNYLDKKITKDKINAHYAEIKKSLKGKKDLKVSHILLDTEEKANLISEKLSKGSDFEKLATEFSTDSSSAKNGGHLGAFREGQLVPEFEATAKKLKAGEISKPVKTQFGWHVIKLEKISDTEIPKLSDIEEKIKADLSNVEFQNYLKELNNKNTVIINLK